MFGLNIDPHNTAGFGNPPPEVLQNLGVEIVRYTYKASRPDAIQYYQNQVRALHERNIRSLIILTNESLTRHKPASDDPAEVWFDYIDDLRRVAVDVADAVAAWNPVIQIWNEPDLVPKPFYEPTLAKPVYAHMLRHLYDDIKAVDSSLTVITAGLASGDPTWMKGVIALMDGQHPFDALAVHPYGQRPQRDWSPFDGWGFGYVGELLRRYNDIAPRTPVYISEIGLRTNNDNVQSEYLRRFYAEVMSKFSYVEHVVWFCYSDGMVSPMGLLASNGSSKRTLTTYRDVAMSAS